MDGREGIEREVEARLAEVMPDVDLLEVTVAGRRGNGTLRAVVDHPDGVDHDLCAAVTEALAGAGLLDRFGIEVWSPGPEPPLRLPRHYRRAVGRRVKLQLDPEESADGRRSRTGTLLAADERALTIATADGIVEIPLSAVRRARALEEAPGDEE
jgi:ribosome maturation factor RimP